MSCSALGQQGVSLQQHMEVPVLFCYFGLIMLLLIINYVNYVMCYEQNVGVARVNQWLFLITRGFINPLNVTPGDPSPGDPADKHPLCLLLFICICFFLCDDDWLKVRNMATKCCMFTLKKKCLTFRVKHHGCIVMICNIWRLKCKSMAVSSSTENSSLSGWKSVETILDVILGSHLGIFWLCVIRLFIRGFVVLTVPNVLLQKGCLEIARSVLKMETI